MLANGITLAYGTAKGTYTKLEGLKKYLNSVSSLKRLRTPPLKTRLKNMSLVLVMLENWNINSHTRTMLQMLLIVFYVMQQTTRQNSSLNKHTQTKPRLNLKDKYLSNLAAVV